MQKNITSLLITFLIYLTTLNVNSQTTVKGIVKDSLGNGIEMLNVFVTYNNGKNAVVAYCYTNKNGKYNLSLKKTGSFLLNFNGLSYENKQIPFIIDSINPKVEIVKDVILKESTFSLDAVVINADRPIVVKKDTISIKVESFTNGTEEVAEDILKKLPGIEVADDGSIKVQGKTIEKVMVEGDDLFDKGYKLLTKNLNADVIDKVEILERFSDNPMLKGIEDSDKIALNITLKEDRKTSLFGNASLGYGTDQFYENKLNLISFNKKTKYYFFGNLNNIGNEPTGDIYQLIYPNVFSKETYVGDNVTTRNFVNMNGDYINLKKNRTNFNNAELASLSGIYNPSKKLKIKGLSFFASDESDFFRNNIQQFTFGDDNFTNTETYKLRKRSRTVFGKWDAIYTINKDALLEYTGKYTIIKGRDKSDLLFNDELLNEQLLSDSKYTDHRITYTQKIQDYKAFQITGRYIYDDKPQQYDVNTFLYEELFPQQSSSDAIQQNIFRKTSFLGLETNYYVNKLKSNLDINIGASQRKDHLDSNLIFKEANASTLNIERSYLNNFSYDFIDLFLKANYKYKLSKKLVLRTGLEAHQLFTTVNSENNVLKERPFYVIPNIGLTWKINKKNIVSTLYKYKTENAPFESLYEGYLLTNYRNFKRGFGEFQQFNGNFFMSNYTLGDWSSSFLVNATFLYQNDDNYKSTNSLITPNFTQTSTILLGDKEFYSLSVSIDTFIDFISSNLKLNLNSSKSDIQNIVNDSQLRNVESTSHLYGVELRSAFASIFNFHLGTKWTYTKVNTTIENTNIDNLSFLDVDFIFSKKLSFHLKNERYYFGNLQTNNSFYFSDFNAQYTIKENKLKLKLSANNIWNTNKFTNFYIGDVSSINNSYRLLPRYLLLKIDFRF